MNYYFAPMEGVTTHLYRNAHHRYFGGVDKYFMPFLSPGRDFKFAKRELRDVIPQHNQGTPVVPQLLTRYSEHFLWAAELMADFGYDEINLNLGCPSGTVVAKGKGSGFLEFPQELDKFLEEIFEKSPLPISIKTRLGRYEGEEFGAILDIFEKYPVAELIVHPRIQKDFYRAPVRLEGFQQAVAGQFCPLCYNGDIRTVHHCGRIVERFPQAEGLMLGRGLIANPALARQCQGGGVATADELAPFLEEIFQGYALAFESRRNGMMRMKELWSYLGELFEGSEKLVKGIRKTSNPDEYQLLEKEILRNCAIRTELAGKDPCFTP